MERQQIGWQHLKKALAKKTPRFVAKDQCDAESAYLLVGVGAPEDVCVTTASFMGARGRGGLEEKTWTAR